MLGDGIAIETGFGEWCCNQPFLPWNLQEKQQKERWGKEAAFQAWRRNTNLLVPIPK